MHRIDTATRAIDKHGAGKDGWTEGTPPMVPPTVGSDDWFDDIQETLAQYIESRGIALVKNTFTQLIAAIATHFPGSSTDNRVARFDGTTGQKLQESPVSISDAGAVSGVTDLTLSGDALYATPPTRVVYVPCTEMGRDTVTAGTAPGWLQDNVGLDSGYVASMAASRFLYVHLNKYVPAGATITKFRVLVDPTTTHATVGDRMYAVLVRYSVSGTTITNAAQSSTVFDDGTAAKQWLDSGTVSLAYTPAQAIAQMMIASSVAASGDRVHIAEITYTDPGPRNY